MINQALKKAQREQLWREAQTAPGLRHLSLASSGRRWPWLLLGLSVMVGVSAGLHGWKPWQSLSGPGTSLPAKPAANPVPLSGGSAASTAPLAGEPLPVATLVAPPPRPLRVSSPPREAVPTALPVPPAAQEAALAPPPQPKTVPNTKALLNQAAEAQSSGRTDDAMTLFQQVVALDPTQKVAYNNLGNLYYQQQQYQQALAMYQRALVLDPQYAKARNNLGNTYLRLAMNDRARQEFTKAVALDDAYGLAHYNLACVYARAGDSAMAARHLQRAIALEPEARLWAQSDDDFARVRTTTPVQQLLEP